MDCAEGKACIYQPIVLTNIKFFVRKEKHVDDLTYGDIPPGMSVEDVGYLGPRRSSWDPVEKVAL